MSDDYQDIHEQNSRYLMAKLSSAMSSGNEIEKARILKVLNAQAEKRALQSRLPAQLPARA